MHVMDCTYKIAAVQCVHSVCCSPQCVPSGGAIIIGSTFDNCHAIHTRARVWKYGGVNRRIGGLPGNGVDGGNLDTLKRDPLPR